MPLTHKKVASVVTRRSASMRPCAIRASKNNVRRTMDCIGGASEAHATARYLLAKRCARVASNETAGPLCPDSCRARACVFVIKRAFTPTCNLFCLETSARWAAVRLLRVEFFAYAECKSVPTKAALPMYTGVRTR